MVLDECVGELMAQVARAPRSTRATATAHGLLGSCPARRSAPSAASIESDASGCRRSSPTAPQLLRRRQRRWPPWPPSASASLRRDALRARDAAASAARGRRPAAAGQRPPRAEPPVARAAYAAAILARTSGRRAVRGAHRTAACRRAAWRHAPRPRKLRRRRAFWRLLQAASTRRLLIEPECASHGRSPAWRATCLGARRQSASTLGVGFGHGQRARLLL